MKYSYETDREIKNYNTEKEMKVIEDTLNNWKYLLYNEKFKDIRNIQMHFIPTKKLDIFKNEEELNYNNIFMDFQAQGEIDSFKYGYIYIKSQYFIFICTVWGETPNMKQFLVGKKISTRNSKLPSWLIDLINSHLKIYENVEQSISAR